MIKTLKQAVRQEKEPFSIPRSVQQLIPVRRIWQEWYLPCGEEVHHDVGEMAAHPP